MWPPPWDVQCAEAPRRWQQDRHRRVVEKHICCCHRCCIVEDWLRGIAHNDPWRSKHCVGLAVLQTEGQVGHQKGWVCVGEGSGDSCSSEVEAWDDHGLREATCEDGKGAKKFLSYYCRLETRREGLQKVIGFIPRFYISGILDGSNS